MNKKIPYSLNPEEIDELKKRKKEISAFVFEQFKADTINKEINTSPPKQQKAIELKDKIIHKENELHNIALQILDELTVTAEGKDTLSCIINKKQYMQFQETDKQLTKLYGNK
jgi:hypothetical protein